VFAGFFAACWRLAIYTRREPGATSFNIDDLAGLRAGHHVLEVGVLIDRARGIVALFSFALNPTLLFVLLFLFARLFAAAFFQLDSFGFGLSTWLWFGLSTSPKLSIPFIAGSRRRSDFHRHVMTRALPAFDAFRLVEVRC